MADDTPIYAYAGAYAMEGDARADFEAIKDAHAAGLIGKYDSALFTKKDDGKVKVKNTDSTARTKGAGWGAAVGGVIGLLFPPTIIAGAIAGAAGGGLIGNVAKGWGHGDIKDLGETLDAGEWGVVLVCESTADVAVDRILKQATKAEKKVIDDEDKEIRKALEG
jgi:uncharacterized membrane protein